VAEGAIAKQTKCRVITPPHASGPHFAEIVDELGMGVVCPKTVAVNSRAEIHNTIWDASRGVEFELTPLLEAEHPFEEGSTTTSNGETTVTVNVEGKALQRRQKRDSGYVSNFSLPIDDDDEDLGDFKELSRKELTCRAT
jgi:hypothetical protein